MYVLCVAVIVTYIIQIVIKKKKPCLLCVFDHSIKVPLEHEQPLSTLFPSSEKVVKVESQMIYFTTSLFLYVSIFVLCATITFLAYVITTPYI